MSQTISRRSPVQNTITSQRWRCGLSMMIYHSFFVKYSDVAVSKVHIHHQHQEKPLRIDRDICNFVSHPFSGLLSKPLLQRFAGVPARRSGLAPNLVHMADHGGYEMYTYVLAML